jgi:hypothetical protein
MMDNNYNKILKDKLNQELFAFDPNAWDKMEQMLDDKPKRRPIFWWWLAGVSSLALIGFGAFAISIFDKNEVASNTSSVSTLPLAYNVNNNEDLAVNLNSQNTFNDDAITNSNSSISSSKEQLPNAKTVTNSNNNNILKSSNSNTTSHTSNLGLHNSKANKLNSKNSNTNDRNEVLYESLAMQKANPIGNEMSGNVSLNKLSTDEYFETNTVEKQNAKSVQFELGVANFLGATGVGKQTDLENRNYHALQNKLSYSVGLSADVLLNNRGAISTGLMYGKTNFKIFQPVNNYVLLNSYESTTQILQIPLGLKFYAFTKNNFRLYANVGMINNIQLKEQIVFDYALRNKPSSSIELSITGNSTNNEMFDANYNDPNNSKNNDKEIAEFFSVNKSNNYYIQLYYGVGAEYALKNKFIFFVEPRFHSDMSLIGLQNKRAYQLGVSSGMRWKF